MKKRLLTILFALVSLMGWAQIEAPTFTFEGDNLVMSTEAMNASIFYGIADLPDLTDETVESVRNSLISLPNYYDQSIIEVKGNVVIKAITVRDEGGTLVQSDTTTLVYGYTLWVELSKAITRGNSVYNQANGNPAVDESLLDDLKWAVEEGEMIYGARGSAPYFEAEHFANTINDLCDQIEVQMGIVPSITTEPYAVLSDNNTVLTFYYDDQKAARGGISVGPFSDFDEVSWYENRESITSVVFDASFADCTTLTSTAYWFFDCSNLTSISGINNLKTDNLTNMSWMFTGCTSLTSLDVSSFNTANVMDMSGMFLSCSSLTSLDMSNFNTENVTNMYCMFEKCSSLTSLDVSNFNTTNVTGMTSMFEGCSSLTSLDVSNFNTANVTAMNLMFLGCSSLTSLDVSNFNTANVTAMQGMFYNCSSLTSLDVTGFNTENVTDMNQMFSDCYSLTNLDVSGFNTEKVTNMQGMFRFCSGLTSLDVSGFNTANVTYLSYMFCDCSGMYLLDVSGFNTAKVEDFTNFLTGCSSLAAVQAGNAAIPDSVYAQIGNPNLLVYVNEASVAPEGIQNVVIDGQAKEIILKDVTEGNNNWYCPQPFTAEKISYTRTFSQQTKIGVSRGWETIALPFKVQTITHATQGVISPFGNYSGNYHFWLRTLTDKGLISVQEINANMPYIISMPNSSEYSAEYNLAGEVTFSAENAYVPETEEIFGETADYAMYPVFWRIEANEDIYALNVGEERSGHPEGSIFEKNYREVRPFEAVTMHLNPSRFAPQFISVADLGGSEDTTELQELKNGRMEELKSDYYDLNGRKVEKPSKGVFIHNGRKVIK